MYQVHKGLFGLSQKRVNFIFIFSFGWDPPQKKSCLALYLFLVFIFSIKNRILI